MVRQVDYMHNREIMIVEDEPGDLELILMAMEKAGPADRIISVSSGEDALEYLQKKKESGIRDISFILLDINLPLMSGIDLLRDLKLDTRLKTIPVIMFTSSGEKKDIEESYVSGANGYVVKPARFSEYVNTLRGINTFWLDINRKAE